MSLTQNDREFLDRITNYANEIMPDIDPQKTQVSFQLEKLRPVMEEIAKEQGVSLEEIFIRYMDLASVASVETSKKMNAELDGILEGPGSAGSRFQI